MTHLDFITDYEMGLMDEERTIKGFQAMIDDGTVWKLQGRFGRTAKILIERGLCHPAVERISSRCTACGYASCRNDACLNEKLLRPELRPL